jgi:spore coat protein U-like protein
VTKQGYKAMKLTKIITVLSASIALHAGAISVSDTEQTSFEIGGEILPECKVSNQTLTGSNALDLTSSVSQAAANVFIWCNTGQSAATTTYSSANQGKLVHETASHQIGYELEVAGQVLDLTQDRAVSQGAGQGTDGSDQSTTVSVKPLVNGFEYSGTYSDTIAVTVSFN